MDSEEGEIIVKRGSWNSKDRRAFGSFVRPTSLCFHQCFFKISLFKSIAEFLVEERFTCIQTNVYTSYIFMKAFLVFQGISAVVSFGSE